MNSKNILKFAVATAAIALLCATSGRVYASASINVSAIDSNYLQLANGQMVPTGDLVEVGDFNISDSSIAALESGGNVSDPNYAILLSHFVPLNAISTGLIGDGTSDGTYTHGYPGAIGATFTGSNPTFASTPIYVMVFNQANTVDNPPTTQVGVFRGGTAWMFPADMAGGGVSIDFDDANVVPLIGSYVANSLVDSPYNDLEGSGYSTVNSFELATVSVPEPSSIVLVAMGLLGGIGLIRRRRS